MINIQLNSIAIFYLQSCEFKYLDDNSELNIHGGNMVKRIKNEITPTLKARDYHVGDVPVEEGTIEAVRDIETKFGEKTVISVSHDKGKNDLFCNATALSNLIDEFGDDDEDWIGKVITTKVEEDETFKNKMIVIYPKKA